MRVTLALCIALRVAAAFPRNLFHNSLHLTPHRIQSISEPDDTNHNTSKKLDLTVANETTNQLQPRTQVNEGDLAYWQTHWDDRFWTLILPLLDFMRQSGWTICPNPGFLRPLRCQDCPDDPRCPNAPLEIQAIIRGKVHFHDPEDRSVCPIAKCKNEGGCGKDSSCVDGFCVCPPGSKASGEGVHMGKAYLKGKDKDFSATAVDRGYACDLKCDNWPDCDEIEVLHDQCFKDWDPTGVTHHNKSSIRPRGKAGNFFANLFVTEAQIVGTKGIQMGIDTAIAKEENKTDTKYPEQSAGSSSESSEQ